MDAVESLTEYITHMNLRRMRYLINRLPMARFRVEKAMSTATKTTAPITGMPGGGDQRSGTARGGAAGDGTGEV